MRLENIWHTHPRLKKRNCIRKPVGQSFRQVGVHIRRLTRHSYDAACIGIHISEVCASEDKYDEPQNICSLRGRNDTASGDQKLSGIPHDSFAGVSGSPVSPTGHENTLVLTSWDPQQSAAFANRSPRLRDHHRGKEMLIPLSRMLTREKSFVLVETRWSDPSFGMSFMRILERVCVSFTYLRIRSSSRIYALLLLSLVAAWAFIMRRDMGRGRLL